MKKYIFNKIANLTSDILNIDKKKLNTKSNSSNIKNWDSLANFQILLSIEKEFKIKIKSHEYEKLNSLSEMVELVKTYKIK